MKKMNGEIGTTTTNKERWGGKKRGSKKASFLEREKWRLFLKSWCHFQIWDVLNNGIKKNDSKPNQWWVFGDNWWVNLQNLKNSGTKHNKEEKGKKGKIFWVCDVGRLYRKR